MMTLAHRLRYPTPSSKRPPARKQTLPQPSSMVSWFLPQDSPLARLAEVVTAKDTQLLHGFGARGRITRDGRQHLRIE
jgi:hypothetical protein